MGKRRFAVVEGGPIHRLNGPRGQKALENELTEEKQIELRRENLRRLREMKEK